MPREINPWLERVRAGNKPGINRERATLPLILHGHLFPTLCFNFANSQRAEELVTGLINLLNS